MKVLVSGSLRGLEKEEEKEELRAAGRELGKCLGAAGHTLVVGSDNQDDIDPFVVEGFLSGTKTSQVEVHLQKGAPKCYQGQANITPRWHRYDDWDVTVLEVVRYNADAVIVIAGRKGVIQAGIAGWMLGRPTIPFGGFGGGAETVWDYGSSDRQRFYFNALTDAEIDQLNGPWEPGVTGEKVVEQLDRCAEYSRRGVVPAPLRVVVGAGILLMLVVWILLLAAPLMGWMPWGPKGHIPLLLAAVCSAGAFGALVRSMRSIRDGVAVTGGKALIDAVLGVAAGFLTAALYLLAQIAINGKLEFPETDADYARVSLIVSMAAVFASLYLDAAFSRFDTLKDSVMSGTYGEKK